MNKNLIGNGSNIIFYGDENGNFRKKQDREYIPNMDEMYKRYLEESDK